MPSSTYIGRGLPFRFELPFQVWAKAGDTSLKRRRIGGIISSTKLDRQNETVLQEGLDFSEFLANGWFNDNHSKDTTGIVGYPEVVRRTTYKGRPAHYVEGYLLEGYEPADKIWDLAQSLQKTGRRLGFSIEGSVTNRSGRDGRIVAAAKVRNVAITNCPVNTDTGLEVLAKSLSAASEEFQRGMSAGYGPQPDLEYGDGSALIPESLEGSPKYPGYRRKKKKRKSLRKAEAVAFVASRYRISAREARVILDRLTAIGLGR